MKRISASTLGIAQGAQVVFSDFADGGAMWTGEGPRESRHIVNFDDRFAVPPTVSVSISMWDMDHKTNSRADITAEQVTTTGFHMVFRTWGDTRVARIRADWLAIGPVSTDDDWDVE